MTRIDNAALVKLAVAAFPRACRPSSLEAAKILAPLVDNSYRCSLVSAVVQGWTVSIPKRIRFTGEVNIPSCTPSSRLFIECLQTRSTDGYQRQAPLLSVLSADEPWTIPFVVMLAGEYVVEIAEHIFSSLPSLNASAYVGFVRENRPLMRLLTAKASSYWNCYFRDAYIDRRAYPGLAFLRELERWAA